MNDIPRNNVTCSDLFDARLEVDKYLDALVLRHIGNGLDYLTRKLFLMDLTLYQSALRGPAAQETINRALDIVQSLENALGIPRVIEGGCCE